MLRAKHPAGAYYLAGYAVECALKACIAKNTKRYEFPDKKLADKCYSHDLEQLLGTAGLQAVYDQEIKAKPQLAVNWATTKDWKETTRYDVNINIRQAKQLYQSITAKRYGVLTWLRKYW